MTAALIMTVVWCLLYGRVPSVALALACAVLGVAFSLLGRHRHRPFVLVDVLAQSSRLNRVSPSLKLWVVLVLMALCVSASNLVVGVFLAVVALILIVPVGGLRLRDYLHLLALPVSFLMINGLALLFELTAQRTGVLGIHVLGSWFCVSAEAQSHAALVMARALGAVSCLYLLSLTTPMSEVIGTLRRVRCPGILIDLMYLTYRYIFILLLMFYTMRDAAASRLGFVDYQTSIRTTGHLYADLLLRSYRQAYRNFDAMESRCYGTGIRFLENRREMAGGHVATAVGITAITLGLSLSFR
ncbi:MAG: cobalt ECF transporter T component CbiQ [Coriobacteriia bacterium]|nr:cobalt ECF transporter T component CbiQ [Coriobacteriia bacterium]